MPRKILTGPASDLSVRETDFKLTIGDWGTFIPMQRQKADLLAYGKHVWFFNVFTLFIALFWQISPSIAKDQITIVALGDSLTAGYGLPQEDAFTVQLEAALQKSGLDVRIVNAGVSGDTSTGGMQRLDWAIADGTDLILLELGANDALRGIEPSVTKASLTAIVEELQSRNIPIFLTGMKAPPNMGADYIHEFDGIYPTLARQYSLGFYPFFLDGVAADPALNQDDAIHPNKEGVAIIVERMLPSLITFIKNK
ncbi:MAG: arylesterase [Sneathiella sp.]